MIKQIWLDCKNCGWSTLYEEPIKNCPSCGDDIIYARYDLDVLRAQNWQSLIQQRKPGLWRYHELLPIKKSANIVTMGEGGTPLIHAENLGRMLGLKYLYIKDERQGPTGSFKDRQASVAISVMKELGIDEAVVASTGNVAIAYSAYAARAGIKLWAFFPDRVPNDKIREVALYGTEVVNVTGTYDQAKTIAANFAKSQGIYYDRGIKSIAAMESMKTIAFEIAEDLGWRAPDWFIQGVSGGMGPIGVIKGFEELRTLGLVDRVPGLGIVQSEGCAPMIEAFNNDWAVAVPVEHPTTVIATLSTGNPGRAYQLLYDMMKQYGGIAESASDEEAFDTTRIMARMDGISVEPATAVAFAGLIKMVQRGKIKSDDIVVFNCSGHTFPVEKAILGEEWARQVDLSNISPTPSVPTKGLLSAVSKVRSPIRQVLVVEDNEDSARLLHRILESHQGYAVTIAHNGVEGLRLARKMKPDLIVSDLMMPEMDGFQLIEALKADTETHDIPIIVLTAKELTPAERQRLAGRIDSMLQKGSFLNDDLLQQIIDTLN
ncbi:MAG: threonine synthase [Phototrophicales bacterium]|nr:MAG: threonine synthase [Phototrophicales bacterium]